MDDILQDSRPQAPAPLTLTSPFRNEQMQDPEKSNLYSLVLGQVGLYNALAHADFELQ